MIFSHNTQFLSPMTPVHTQNTTSREILFNLIYNIEFSAMSAKKRKLVGRSGACITSEEAISQLQEEVYEKKQKLIEKENRIKKKESDKKKEK